MKAFYFALVAAFYLGLTAVRAEAYEAVANGDGFETAAHLPPPPAITCTTTCPERYRNYPVRGAGDTCSAIGNPGQVVTCRSTFVDGGADYICTPVCTVQ